MIAADALARGPPRGSHHHERPGRLGLERGTAVDLSAGMSLIVLMAHCPSVGTGFGDRSGFGGDSIPGPNVADLALVQNGRAGTADPESCAVAASGTKGR